MSPFVVYSRFSLKWNIDVGSCFNHYPLVFYPFCFSEKKEMVQYQKYMYSYGFGFILMFCISYPAKLSKVYSFSCRTLALKSQARCLFCACLPQAKQVAGKRFHWKICVANVWPDFSQHCLDLFDKWIKERWLHSQIIPTFSVFMPVVPNRPFCCTCK